MEDRFFTVEAVLIDQNGQQTQIAARTSFFTRRALGRSKCRGAISEVEPLFCCCVCRTRALRSCSVDAEAAAAAAEAAEDEDAGEESHHSTLT